MRSDFLPELSHFEVWQLNCGLSYTDSTKKAVRLGTPGNSLASSPIVIFVGDVLWIFVDTMLVVWVKIDQKNWCMPQPHAPVETAGFRGSSDLLRREHLNETWLERKCRGQSPWPLLVWSFWTWGEPMERVWQTLVSSLPICWTSLEGPKSTQIIPNPHFLLDCESCQPSKSKKVNWAWGILGRVSGRYPQRKPHMGQRWFRRRPTHRFIRCLDLMTQQGQPTKSTKFLRTVGIVCKLESLYNHIYIQPYIQFRILGWGTV